MSRAGSQQRTLLALLAALRPHWRSDRHLPARIQSLLARNRAFGSRDRRLYRELIYTTLRYLPWIEPHLDPAPDLAVRLVAWLAADAPASENFRAVHLADWPPCPFTLAEKISTLSHPGSVHWSLGISHWSFPPPLPAWFRDHCPEAFDPPQLDTLLARAPLWLRLQTFDTARVTDEFSRLGWRFEPSSVLPGALRLRDEVDVAKTSAYTAGLIEVQDLGSQLLLESVRPAAGERWLDACAGAGGKTLQLAALLGPAGHVDAHDIRPAALAELALRASRAGIDLVTVHESRSENAALPPSASLRPSATARLPFASLRILDAPPAPTALYDGVLVDAPCSGTGTWRRAPHLKWTTTPDQIATAAVRQLAILTRFAAHVRPGGRLVYATCSLSRHENEAIVTAFLAANPAFSLTPPARTFSAPLRDQTLTFLPALHDTDGFFVASLHRGP